MDKATIYTIQACSAEIISTIALATSIILMLSDHTVVAILAFVYAVINDILALLLGKLAKCHYGDNDRF